MSSSEIIVVGAGASGLMVARELAKAGKSVIVLEAQERTGGRIKPLSEEAFGYPAQAGAEFLHGEAKFIKISRGTLDIGTAWIPFTFQ